MTYLLQASSLVCWGVALVAFSTDHPQVGWVAALAGVVIALV